MQIFEQRYTSGSFTKHQSTIHDTNFCIQNVMNLMSIAIRDSVWAGQNEGNGDTKTNNFDIMKEKISILVFQNMPNCSLGPFILMSVGSSRIRTDEGNGVSLQSISNRTLIKR